MDKDKGKSEKMNGSREETISANALRSRLYDTFKNSGVENALKAQLRIELVRILKRQTLKGNASETPLIIKAINSLFVDYLQSQNHQFTLSVYLPESGMANQEGSHVESCKDGLIVQIFREIGKLQPLKVDKDNQTDAPKETLDKKLQSVDEDYSYKIEVERTMPYRSIEERMIKYQRECDERSRNEIQSEMTRFKDLELSKMRLEESSKYREALNNERIQLEKKLNEKMEKLRAREMEVNDALLKKEQDLLKIDYEQRQKMMLEVEAIKQREAEARRQKDLNAKELRIMQERITEREESIQLRVDEAHRIVDQMRAKFDEDLEAFKVSYQKSLEDEKESVKRERARLLEEMKHFELEKEPQHKLYERIWKLEEETKIYLQKIQISQEHANTLNVKLKSMQEEVDRLTSVGGGLSRPHAFDADGTRQKENLTKEQEVCSNLEKENRELQNTVDELKESISELQDLHEQEIQDLKEDHKLALELEKSKWIPQEHEFQREKQRIREELKMEVGLTQELRRALDEKDVEISQLRDQTLNPNAFLAPQHTATYMTMPSSKYTLTELIPKLDFNLPQSFRVPQYNNSQIIHKPPAPVPADAWRAEFERTLNGIAELEREDMLVQRKYFDMKSGSHPANAPAQKMNISPIAPKLSKRRDLSSNTKSRAKFEEVADSEDLLSDISGRDHDLSVEDLEPPEQVAYGRFRRNSKRKEKISSKPAKNRGEKVDKRKKVKEKGDEESGEESDEDSELMKEKDKLDKDSKVRTRMNKDKRIKSSKGGGERVREDKSNREYKEKTANSTDEEGENELEKRERELKEREEKMRREFEERDRQRQELEREKLEELRKLQIELEKKKITDIKAREEKEERDRQDRERIEKEERDRQERERIEKERDRQERERIEKERDRQERERIEKEERDRRDREDRENKEREERARREREERGRSIIEQRIKEEREKRAREEKERLEHENKKKEAEQEEKDRQTREAKKAEEILQQIRDRRAKELAAQQEKEKPGSDKDSSSLGDFDIDAGDILDEYVFSLQPSNKDTVTMMN